MRVAMFVRLKKFGVGKVIAVDEHDAWVRFYDGTVEKFRVAVLKVLDRNYIDGITVPAGGESGGSVAGTLWFRDKECMLPHPNTRYWNRR
jgi:hypothetical protein